MRRPPRGVPKADFAKQNWYDVWLPDLAPSEALVKLGQRAQDEKDWTAFARQYRKEMASPGKARVLDLLAALSHHAELLGRLLLRGRGALPPLGVAQTARRARGPACGVTWLMSLHKSSNA